jgi:hypothetical protein
MTQGPRTREQYEQFQSYMKNSQHKNPYNEQFSGVALNPVNTNTRVYRETYGNHTNILVSKNHNSVTQLPRYDHMDKRETNNLIRHTLRQSEHFTRPSIDSRQQLYRDPKKYI